jgi:hypothetical protein
MSYNWAFTPWLGQLCMVDHLVEIDQAAVRAVPCSSVCMCKGYPGWSVRLPANSLGLCFACRYRMQML